VIGSRLASSAQRRVLLYWHSVADRFLTWLANVLNDVNLTDMESGYKAVWADVLRRIPIRSERFGTEPELVTRFAQWGLRQCEVPIGYHGRTRAEGKKIGWRDAAGAAWCLLKFRFLDTRFTTNDRQWVLSGLGRACRLNRWMFSRLAPYVGRRGWWAMPRGGILRRLGYLRYVRPLRRLALLPWALAGVLVDLIANLDASRLLKSGRIEGLWDAKRTTRICNSSAACNGSG
jgi:hypothetical protein